MYITPKIDFHFEEFFYYGKERIVVLIIPAALGQPTCFFDEPYIRIDSHVTKLAPYTDWIREIYNSGHDWTAEVVDGATLADLDADAILEARKGYKERFPKQAKACDEWDDATFLDRAKLTSGGKITRGTLLLVGKEESAHFLEHISQLVWKLQTKTETAGEIFTIPYVLSTSLLLKKIRNYRFKIYRKDSLIPAEVWKYDEDMVLEAVHNCIAHQQYERNARIIVTETENDLTFWNAGDFFEGTYEDYMLGTKTPRKYRNPFLAAAMVKDRVQKHKPLSAEAVKELRKRNLVEGRKNALIVSKGVAQATEQEAEYTRAKGFTDEFCMDLIEKAVREHERLSRPKIDELITPYLPAALDEGQKYRKIGNLLTKLKTDGRIHLGSGKMWMPGPEN